MAFSDSLGTARTVELPQGVVGYRECGDGPPVVFVHGLLVNADLWRAVVPKVAEAGYRCLAPDWPLGSHERAMGAGADLSPPGLAGLIEDFLAELELSHVTLVANDTGGALVQMLMARGSERVGRVVLASCDALERFFPPLFRPLSVLARMPGSAWLLAQVLRSRAVRGLPIAYGWLSHRPVPAAVMDSYLLPARRSAGVRRDLRRFLRGVHRRHTLEAAAAFSAYDRPVLLAWGEDDRLFPLSLAHRLAALLPDARVSVVAGSRTFVPEDRPEELGDLIVEFAHSTVSGGGR
ncbi:Pimeloyl-ACP methyl ester carboxylesterase [Streptomyces sp. 3213]|uniref:alpha/beta fold hydrolase n=1 Tax=Streptomyces sp. 3213.3 TaxID=1855348 RepID=UPI00089A53C8|nr:alpha/beta hydrolase [Streptomyces sp. 3213.3]SEC25295.1 Pimeloyl-ACP methyl ester carboxylesterase [Streptomyces sp. 3213] [Streptomyces sp. 3213.3]